MPSTTALIVAITPIILGIFGLVGTRWASGIQRKAAENEARLKGFEGYDHTYANLRADYDRVVAEAAAYRVRAETAEALHDADRREKAALSLLVAQRDQQIERWMIQKENE